MTGIGLFYLLCHPLLPPEQVFLFLGVDQVIISFLLNFYRIGIIPEKNIPDPVGNDFPAAAVTHINIGSQQTGTINMEFDLAERITIYVVAEHPCGLIINSGKCRPEKNQSGYQYTQQKKIKPLYRFHRLVIATINRPEKCDE